MRRNALHALLGVALGVITGAIPLLPHAMVMLLPILTSVLLLAYLVWLGVLAVSAFSDAARNPWRLGVHDRFARGPTRVVNRTPAPLVRSTAAPLTPWWAAAVVVLLLLGLTGVADTVARLLNPTGSTPATTAASPHTVAVQPPAPSVRRTPSAPRSSPPRTTAAFPDDAVPCPQRYGPTGTFTRSAIGNDHTSCPFAEEVRIAYADRGQPGSVQYLRVISPVTHASVDMTCGPSPAGYIVCRGGSDAIVYVI